tara:strand:- start:518 stop:850 length:333 start_codon:yes stop_codon:yes gene_type:complete
MIMVGNKIEEDMMEMFETEFVKVTTEYLEASEALAAAAGLAGEDPIKQDMVAFVKPEFLKMCARSEGIRLMAEKSYNENREFIIAEMKEVTILNLKLVEQIKKKLDSLSL